MANQTTRIVATAESATRASAVAEQLAQKAADAHWPSKRHPKDAWQASKRAAAAARIAALAHEEAADAVAELG